MLPGPAASQKVQPERTFFHTKLFSRSKSTQPRRTTIDSAPSQSSPASPQSSTQSITRNASNYDPRTLSQSPTMPDLSANHVPVEPWGGAYPSQLNPPAEKSGTVLSPSSLDAYPSHPHEEFHPPGQVIRLERSQRQNGQIYSNDSQQSAGSYIEASYQPPPPVHATYQPPPPRQASRNNTHRALPVPTDKASRALPATDVHPPSYPSPAPPTQPTSRFLPSPPTSPPNSISSPQSFSRSHSPSSTVLPDYSSGRVSYSPVRTGRAPLQVPVRTTPSSRPVHPEYAQYPETTSYSSTSRAAPSRVPDAPVQYSNISISTDNGSRPRFRYSGSGNGSSVSSSPTRHAFHLPASSLLPSSASSDSSGRKSSTSGGVPTTPSTSFVFPGSRSVARPKKLPKVKSHSKSWRWKDLAGKSPLSEAPNSEPPLQTAPSSTSLPNSNKATIASAESSNPTNILPKFPDMTYYETSSIFSDESRKTSTSGSSGKPSPAYVYPVGRSRAQPKLVPHGSKGHPVRKLPGSVNSGESEGRRTGFMAKLLKKRAKASKSVDGSNTIPTGSSVESGSTKEVIAPANGNKLEGYRVVQETIPGRTESRARAERMKSRIGSYPLDPYDSVLLDNDRHTGELLARLNPTGSPSFHNYGNSPPTSVLDLGCGQGHWVVDAAIAWKGYGTKVTGYDMVDVSKGLLPWVIEQGVTGNVQFVRGNFLKQRLPFDDNSFDLVRMSCLALCITPDSWIFVLQEVYRVLVIGGRLELIDDLIFFPYGKESTLLDIPDSASDSPVPSLAPRLDISIPSASFTTFSIYDSETNNPGLGAAVDNEEARHFHELYGVEEEDAEDAETLSGRSEVHALPDPSHNPRAPRQTRTNNSSSSDVNLRSWTRAHATSEDLEALFEHMLLHKFGINKNPSEFILGLMKEVFGHAQEINTMHLTLAPPKTMISDVSGSRGRQSSSVVSAEAYMLGGSQFGRSSRRESMGLSQAPGLVLWPSTFIPMNQFQIEIHASKHLRMLLSCKKFLLEHAIEVTDDDEVDERAVLEALEEYESFLRRRFDPPVLLTSTSNDQDSETASIQGSIAESISSDSLDAMREIESELRPRYSWQVSASQDGLVPATPPTPKPVDQLTAPNFSSASISHVSPISSRERPTHVRTFRIYEAIKLDEAIFGSSALGLSGLSQ